ncbi:Growth-regulating factor [Psidium guajava]|nr:Growth-regulating factor [Psidium guajava]
MNRSRAVLFAFSCAPPPKSIRDFRLVRRLCFATAVQHWRRPPRLWFQADLGEGSTPFYLEQDDGSRLGRISLLSSRNRGRSSRSSNIIPSSSLTFVFFQRSEGRLRGGAGGASRVVRGKWLCLLGWPGWFGGGGGGREGRSVAQASARAAYTAPSPLARASGPFTGSTAFGPSPSAWSWWPLPMLLRGFSCQASRFRCTLVTIAYAEPFSSSSYAMFWPWKRALMSELILSDELNSQQPSAARVVISLRSVARSLSPCMFRCSNGSGGTT